jgi:uncharacterized protein
MDLNYKNKIVTPLIYPYSPQFAGVFGSVARGESNDKSDIDILIKFPKPLNFYKFIGLENKLSDALKTKVDLVSFDALHPMVKSEAENDLKIFYGQRA